MSQQSMGIAQPPMQRPQVPPQMARTPQFNAAKQVVMGGLPQIYEQLQELITLEAVDLVNSAKRQEAMDGDPGQNNMQVVEGNIKSNAQQGIMNALANMQRPQQPPQQPPMPQQAMGLPQLPANNMAMPRAAQGGIVGFDDGGNVEGNNFSRQEFMYGPLLKNLGVGPMYDFGGELNEDFMNRAKKRAAVEKYGPDAAMPVGSNQPIPMLMQKYGSERVMEFLEGQKRFNEIEGNVSPQAREQFEMEKANFMSRFSDMVEDIRQTQSGSLDISEEVGMGVEPMPPMPSNPPTPLNAIRRPQKLSGMAGGGIVAFNPGGFVEIDGKQVPVYQQQFRDFTEPSDQQKDFEDIVSWIQTYNVEPEISNAILRNPNSVAGDQIDTLKQILVGAGGRTLDEINRMVANFPSFNTGQNVNPRGERDFSRLEDSPEPQGLMALGQRRAGENEERRRANRSQPMTEEQLMIAQDPMGFSRARGLLEDLPEKPPLRRMELEEQKPRVDADFIRSYLTGNAAPDEEGIASSATSILPEEETDRPFGLKGIIGRLDRERRDIFGLPPEVGPPTTRQQALQEVKRTQGEVEQGLRDSMQAFDPLRLKYPQLREAEEKKRQPLADARDAAFARYQNIVKQERQAEELAEIQQAFAGAGIELPPELQAEMATSIDNSGESGVDGPYDVFGMLKETLGFDGGVDDEEVAREVIETSPEGGEATAGVVGEVDLTPPKSQADQIAEAGFTSNIQNKPQAGLAAFDPDARANTNENTSTSVVEISELVDSVGSGGTGVNYQAEMDRIIARDTNPIRTLAQYGMAFGKGKTPLEGMQLGSEMLNGIEKKLDADRRALMGLIEAQRISERDAKIARQRLAIQQDQVNAMREGDYARVLGSIFASNQRLALSAGDLADIRSEISQNEQLTGTLRSRAEETLLRRALGEDFNKSSFFGRSEAEKMLADPAFQAQVDILVGQLEAQETKRIAGQ
jgi:hypothetical protein